MVFSVFHVSFFKLNLHTVSESNTLFQNYTRIGKKIHDDLSAHETLQHHLTSMARLLEFKNKFYNPSARIYHNVNEDSVERVKTNRSILTAIIKSIEFCGTNGIAVRRHRDDGALTSSDISKKSGNLRCLKNFRIDAGDKILENHCK